MMIRVRPNEQLAIALRRAGLQKIVDSTRVRNLLGIPVRHQKTPDSVAAAEPKGPLVSVIVPAFNVAEYLEDAVGTVQRQTHRNLEIVIVNDGSTDETGEIADRLASADKRVRVVHKQNAGLGAARNTGLSATSGQYVTFVDSDDQLMPDAIGLMLASLEATDSDFAIGAVERFNSTRTWVPAWVGEVHDTPRLGIQASDHPAVLWDVFVWNKLFRRDVWDARVGLFPEGVLYEDQECTARLYVEGATFDCLTETVYRWRFRDDGSSITQNKHSTEDLSDRLLVARTVRGVLAGCDDEDLLRTWYAKLLGDDLYWYYREVPRAECDFWELLQSAVQEFAAETAPSAISSIRFDRRLHLLAIARGTREDFEKVLYYFQDHPGGWSTRALPDGSAVAQVAVLDELSFTLKSTELALEPATEPVKVTLLRQLHMRDGSVSFEGFAHTVNAAASNDRLLRAALVVRGTEGEGMPESRIELEIGSLIEPFANIAVRDTLNDHAGSGFRVTISSEVMQRLLEAGPGAGASREGILEIEVEDFNASWTTTVLHLNGAGCLKRLASGHPTADGKRLDFSMESGELVVSARQVRFVVANAQISGSEIGLAFRDVLYEETSKLSVVLARDGRVYARDTAQRDPEGAYRAELSLPISVPDMKSNYRGTVIEVHDANGVAVPLDSDAVVPRSTSTGVYGLAPNKFGHVQVERYLQFGEARNVQLNEEGTTLRIEGFSRFDRARVRQATPSLMLWSPAQTIYPSRLEYIESTGEFVCEFPLAQTDVSGADSAFPMGQYLLGMMLPTGTERASTFTLLAGAELSEAFPMQLREGRSRVLLQRRPRDGLEVILSAPFAEDERGQLAQQRLVTSFHVARNSRKPASAVLFESFGGRSIGDSPRAIDAVLSQERPDLRRYWTVRDHTVAVPEGATPVVMYSRAWYEALATSRYLVNNNNFPAFFRKGAQQRYIQTWHGTPLKRIGNDVPAANLSLNYRKLMQREAESGWDLLLAQTPWAAGVLSAAFGYDGPGFSDGYPRNDSLFAADVDERRRRVRRYLGIERHQFVVLYAPTWRDNHKGADGRYLRPEFLDAADVRSALGADAVLLTRGHANHAGAAAAAKGPHVRDVSGYPDINDLYLAADALVTDYSSVQFDFVNTGKPIVFLAPDIEAYRDSVRGFYFDFESTAPGPIVRTSREAAEALCHPAEITTTFEDSYREFRQRFAAQDDGEASQRLVRAAFQE